MYLVNDLLFCFWQIVIYPLEKCAAEALIGDTIECTEYSLRIPLSYLVPDLLLTDLPPHLTVELSQFQFNPQVSWMKGFYIQPFGSSQSHKMNIKHLTIIFFIRRKFCLHVSH